MHEGHYKFTMKPLGLTNTPLIFKSLMNSIIKIYPHKFVVVFFDDILMYSKSMEAHVEHLKLIIQTLRKHKLYLWPTKCFIENSQVEYLGHSVTRRYTPQSLQDKNHYKMAHSEKYLHVKFFGVSWLP